MRIAAAEALCRFGAPPEATDAQAVLVDHCDWGRHDVFIAIAALNAVSACGDSARSLTPPLRQLPGKGPLPDKRYSEYVPRLLEYLK